MQTLQQPQEVAVSSHHRVSTKAGNLIIVVLEEEGTFFLRKQDDADGRAGEYGALGFGAALGLALGCVDAGVTKACLKSTRANHKIFGRPRCISIRAPLIAQCCRWGSYVRVLPGMG